MLQNTIWCALHDTWTCLQRLCQHGVQVFRKLGRLIVAAEIVVNDRAQQRVAEIALQMALLRFLHEVQTTVRTGKG